MQANYQLLPLFLIPQQMRTVIQIAFILVSIPLMGQPYLNYYEGINQARIKVSVGEYEQALRIYSHIFEEFEFEFARDCVNAAETAVFLDDSLAAKKFIELSLRRGVPIEYFSKHTAFEQFRLTNTWKQILLDSAKLATAYQQAIDFEVRAEINTMFSEDQQIRKSYYKWYNFLLRPFISKKWEKLNKRQVERIMEITQQKGFPGEKLIGIDKHTFHPKIPYDQLSAGMPIVILIHHFSKPNPSHDSILKEQVYKGNLHTQHYGIICDFEAKFGKGKYETDGYYGAYPLPQTTSPVLNQKRKQIGLMRVEAVKKLNLQSTITKFWNRLY